MKLILVIILNFIMVFYYGDIACKLSSVASYTLGGWVATVSLIMDILVLYTIDNSKKE